MAETPSNDVTYRNFRAIHWIMAFLFFFLALATGYLFDGVVNADQRIRVHQLHQSLGLLFMLMLFVRIYWIWRYRGIRAHFEYVWQRRFAYLNYSILYLIMIALIVSGLVRVISGEDHIHFFGLVDFAPPQALADRAVKNQSADLHDKLTRASYFFLALHFIGAFNFYYQPLKWKLFQSLQSRLFPH